jgi:protein-S-isoprenylcysteine O-methyltransferase Ste14
MGKKLLRFIRQIIFQRIIGLATFLLAAGTLTSVRGWIYFVVYFVISIVVTFVLSKISPEVLEARSKTNWGETKTYDKVLVPLYAFLQFIGIYIAAGLCVRFDMLTSLPIFWCGIVLVVVFSVLSAIPLYDNRHFEGTMRIQNDRAHKVCDKGSYSIVRHPGYILVILGSLSVAIVFGVLAFWVALAIAITLIIRTAFEDKVLRTELPGYAEYAEQVKYRLVPFVW